MLFSITFELDRGLELRVKVGEWHSENVSCFQRSVMYLGNYNSQLVGNRATDLAIEQLISFLYSKPGNSSGTGSVF